MMLCWRANTPSRPAGSMLGMASIGVGTLSAPAGAAPAATADARPLSKTWQLSFVQLNNVVDVEDAERGVLLGLKESGLVQGRDFAYQVRNAQGDMATVTTLVDAAANDSDLIVTFSTPTLQAALQRASIRQWLRKSTVVKGLTPI